MRKIFVFILLSFLISFDVNAFTLSQSVNSDHRDEKNMLRDQYRNPLETLNFFRVEPSMTIVELSPGRGWYTEILAKYMF